MSNKTIAIIPARGNSKRIPRKNIRIFAGQPIIKYSIDAAIDSKIFDEVMVSTNDHEIAEYAMKCGASVPFMRSEKNSGDHSSTANVLLEVLECYKKIRKEFNYTCCIYPTAPFVTGKKLTEAQNKLIQHNVDSVVPVTAFSFPIFRSVQIEDDRLKMFWPEHINTRTQDLPKAYHDCGQFYFLNTISFLQQKNIFTGNTYPIIIPESEVQDIDNEEDWKIAEIKYKLLTT